MKFRKAYLFVFVLLCALVFMACDKKPILETLTFSGADGVTLDYEEEFNVLEGVTVIGNDDVDYSHLITYTTTGTIDSTTHLFDTTKTGEFLIQYKVEIGSVKATKNRIVKVNNPPRTSMVLNGDFSMGVTGWDKFEADGGTVALSVDEGALKLEIVSGSNPWTPRISQMDVPFEEGKTYEISFKAKASEAGKLIHLQVGEIIPNDPWFINFKPNAQVEFATLTTEWANYSYKFTHTQDNPRGGLLFEFGKFQNSNISCTVWMDDIDIQESTPDEDTRPPVISGVSSETSIIVGTDFNPLAGVTAEDNVDGDVTSAIQFLIYKVVGDVETLVEEIDTSVVSLYKIVYTVKDSKDNEGEAILMLSIVDMIFEETDIVANGDFADDGTGWTSWRQDWGDMPTITVEYIDNQAVITYDKPGDAGWAIQFNQVARSLERGVTYKIQFDAKVSVARTINVAMEDPDRNNQVFFRQNGIEITTDMTTFEYIFTVPHEASNNVKLTFELGATTNFQAGTFTLDNVLISTAVKDEVLYNQDFSVLGYRPFFANWLSDNPTGSLGVVDGALKLDITNVGALANSWELQVIQDAFALKTGADNEGHIQFEAGKTYKLTFDCASSTAGKVNIAFGWFDDGGGWHAYHVTTVDDQPEVNAVLDTYSIEFTFASDADLTNKSVLKWEIGTLFAGATGAQHFILDNIKLEVEDGDDFVDTNQIINGTITEVVGWTLFVNDGSAAGMNVVDGNLVIDVTTLGTDAWHVHLYNGETTSLSVGNYKFVIKAKSSVERVIRANLIIPTEGYRSILDGSKWDITLTDTPDTFYLDFEVTADLMNKVKVEIDFGTLTDLTSVPSIVTIYEIIIYKVI